MSWAAKRYDLLPGYEEPQGRNIMGSCKTDSATVIRRPHEVWSNRTWGGNPAR